MARRDASSDAYSPPAICIIRIRSCLCFMHAPSNPHFLGFADNLLSLGYLADVVESFGWEQSSELVFNLGAQLLGRRRGEPEQIPYAMRLIAMTSWFPRIRSVNPLNEHRRIRTKMAFAGRHVCSVNIEKSFQPRVTVRSGERCQAGSS